ncbi:MAG TPA: hypothetical protein VGA73_08615 [Candidatus Binatia bacterium]
MAHKGKLVLLLLGFLLPFLVAGSAAAGGSKVNFRLQTKLEPCCGDPEPEGEGKAEYRTQTVNGQLKQERFRAEVKIPVPSAGLNIADAAAAESADVRVSLSGGGTYAVCRLEFVELELENDFEDGILIESKATAVYLVDVARQLKKGGYQLRELNGSCDIDTATVDTQNGVPAVQSGDVATATVVASGDTDFLDGTLAE